GVCRRKAAWTCDQRSEGGGGCDGVVHAADVDRKVRAESRVREQCWTRGDAVGARRGEIDISSKRLARTRKREAKRAGEHRAERAKPILEGPYDAEVAAASSQRPHEIGVALVVDLSD